MSESVDKWMSRLNSDKTRKDYGTTFKRFMKWKEEHGGKFATMTPDEMVAYQKSCDNGENYEIEDMIQTWIRTFTELRYNSKRIYYKTIRSFFAHNRSPLPKDAGFKIASNVPKVPSNLKPEDIKKIVLSSNPMYQALILCMVTGGMGTAEVMHWNENGWPSLYEQLQDEGVKVIKIGLPGRKSSRNKNPYYTLVGGDALRALKGYLGKNVTPDRRAIFLNQYKVPIRTPGLTMYWRRILARLGIIEPVKGKGSGVRYGYGLHELRDNFRTLWARSGALADIAEFMMGHRIDALGYNQVFRDEEYAKEEYLKALPFLNVVSGALDLEQNQELLELRKRIAELEAADEKHDEINALTRDVADLKATLEAIQAFGGLAEGTSTATIFENVKKRKGRELKENTE